MAHFARKPTIERDYIKYLAEEKKHKRCAFCLFDASYNHFVEQTEKFWVVESRFPYAYWDNCRVKEHLMIVPKRHIATFAEFDADESREYFEVMARYEENGYSIYTRAPQNVVKTYPHLHTHLFKLNDRKNKFTLYIEKPFINIHK